ncbi:hypothetical protein SEA_JACOREN57_53 [Mycobacterium phage JacoRen57]|nr:hypothetical protein SEA_JACOREN57_53 [Mycobacterium phage JacoRen57]
MPANLIKQWADGHGAAAVSRVVKRIERFANNTTDPETSAAAKELIALIKEESK